MKNNTGKKFAAIRKEVIEILNSPSYVTNPLSAKDYKNTNDLLCAIVNYYAEFEASQTHLFTAQWLLENFSNANLIKHNIYTGGEYHSAGMANTSFMVLIGNADMMLYYYKGERVKIVMFEGAKAHVNCEDRCNLRIESYGNNKIHY